MKENLGFADRAIPTALCALLLVTAGAAHAAGASGTNEIDPLEIALSHLEANKEALGLTAGDISELVVTDQYLSSHTGVTHIYLRQQFQDIEVIHGNLNINILADGVVLNLGNRFVSNLSSTIQNTVASLSAVQAVERAAAELGLGVPQELQVLLESSEPDRRSLLSDGGISLEAIPARLVYQSLPSGALRVAWDLEIYQLDASHYWSVRVDAQSGALLDVSDWVDSETYRVFPLPLESPDHSPTPPPADGRPLIVDPFLDATFPPGPSRSWHDTDGAPGAEFTIHRGNNVHAYEDRDGNDVPQAVEPDCGGGLLCDFDFPINFGIQEPPTYVDAAVTNLFYWNNIIHDVMYQYGFDEPAGNFQVNNHGLGGLGGDDVRAEAQDNDIGGANCNAFFSTPPDGGRPRMEMFTCNMASPERDGDFDHEVIVHEFGHGISNRLTGGPANVNCLNNQEQMGEGWSDWYGLMFTQEVGDAGPDARGLGAYLFGQGPNGPGIRDAPYSTDFAVNNFTYGNLPGQAIPHGVGFVWATMAWEMTWEMIDQFGFNSDFYQQWTTGGGNNLAWQLVTDGLKLQVCSPGFVDGRDAILAADVALTGGTNACLIWRAFAKRGLGLSADQGSPFSRSDGTEAFDLPPECEDFIFADGFESGNVAFWSSSTGG